MAIQVVSYALKVKLKCESRLKKNKAKAILIDYLIKNQICLYRCLEAASCLDPTLISMADQPSSTAAKKMKNLKKGGGKAVKFVQDLFKRPKSANDSASQSNSTRGNDAGSTELTASCKYIDPF